MIFDLADGERYGKEFEITRIKSKHGRLAIPTWFHAISGNYQLLRDYATLKYSIHMKETIEHSIFFSKHQLQELQNDSLRLHVTQLLTNI